MLCVPICPSRRGRSGSMLPRPTRLEIIDACRPAQPPSLVCRSAVTGRAGRACGRREGNAGILQSGGATGRHNLGALSISMSSLRQSHVGLLLAVTAGRRRIWPLRSLCRINARGNLMSFLSSSWTSSVWFSFPWIPWLATENAISSVGLVTPNRIFKNESSPPEPPTIYIVSFISVPSGSFVLLSRGNEYSYPLVLARDL